MTTAQELVAQQEGTESTVREVVFRMHGHDFRAWWQNKRHGYDLSIHVKGSDSYLAWLSASFVRGQRTLLAPLDRLSDGRRFPDLTKAQIREVLAYAQSRRHGAQPTNAPLGVGCCKGGGCHRCLEIMRNNRAVMLAIAVRKQRLRIQEEL